MAKREGIAGFSQKSALVWAAGMARRRFCAGDFAITARDRPVRISDQSVITSDQPVITSDRVVSTNAQRRLPGGLHQGIAVLLLAVFHCIYRRRSGANADEPDAKPIWPNGQSLRGRPPTVRYRRCGLWCLICRVRGCPACKLHSRRRQIPWPSGAQNAGVEPRPSEREVPRPTLEGDRLEGAAVAGLFIARR